LEAILYQKVFSLSYCGSSITDKIRPSSFACLAGINSPFSAKSFPLSFVSVIQIDLESTDTIFHFKIKIKKPHKMCGLLDNLKYYSFLFVFGRRLLASLNDFTFTLR
jgi:hypothetical protein